MPGKTKSENSSEPIYYKEGFYPQDKVKDQDRIEVRQAFLNNLLSKYTPVEVQSELVMKPVPAFIGQLQFTIERNESGFNKLEPKYILKLSDGNKLMMKAVKIFDSATKHYKITIESDHIKYHRHEEENYVGRLRSNFGRTNWYIYD